MMSIFRKATVKWAIVALALIFLAGCSGANNPSGSKSNSPSQTDATGSQNTKDITNSNSDSIVYKNTVYGFNFTLPSSWQGYSIIAGIWDGNDSASGNATETGPMISIRHPQWTSQQPRQDIPIMIFTIDQWKSLKQGNFHIGAAPIEPGELDRNGVYVFALPARYNYSFPTGYEEVQKILESKPVQTTEINSHEPARVMLLNIMQLAKQGKVINCEFPVKTSNFGDVENKWGKADNTAWIPAAKGTYSTYFQKNVAFGWNKGLQIFEVRSFDSGLKNITLSAAQDVFGTPVWIFKANNQKIIGYTIGEFKIEMVFPLPSSKNPNPIMDHYNILYPDGTINSMANDPGRQW